MCSSDLQASANSADMRIDDNARWDTKSRSQHDIGRLSTHTGQLDKIRQLSGYLAVMLVYQLSAAGLDVLGFIAKETSTFDVFFQLARRGRGKILCGRVTPKKVLGDHIYALIRALGG